MLPVRVIGGPGRRYRQREQERTREKRTVRSRRNAREKRGNLPRTAWNVSACRCRKVHANAAMRGRRIQKGKIYRDRLVDRQKAQITKARGARISLVQPSTKSPRFFGGDGN
jgi:hypothetical protein